MPAYDLIEPGVQNPDGLGPYVQAVSATISKHGGRYLVRGGNAEVAEGVLGFPMKVVLEFPSLSAGKAWYGSPGYQEILPARLANSTGKFVWVEGA